MMMLDSVEIAWAFHFPSDCFEQQCKYTLKSFYTTVLNSNKTSGVSQLVIGLVILVVSSLQV